MDRKITVALLVSMLATGANVSNSSCAAENAAQPATVWFAKVGDLLSWQPVGHDAVLLETSRGGWLRADFTAPCRDLPFTFSISLVSEPNGHLDRYSSILVDGQRCWFRDVRQDSAPSSSEGRHLIDASH